MNTKQTSLKTLVELRASDYNSIAFKQMDFEGGLALMLDIEDTGGSASFFFEDARELVTFCKRVKEAYDQPDLFVAPPEKPPKHPEMI